MENNKKDRNKVCYQRSKFCPHCRENVSVSTNYGHKRNYMQNGVWVQKQHSTMACISYSTVTNQLSAATNVIEENFQFDASVEQNSEDDENTSMAMDTEVSSADDLSTSESETDDQSDSEPELLVDDENESYVDNEDEESENINPFILIIINFLFAWQARFNVSDNALSFLLSGLSTILKFIVKINRMGGFDEIIEQIPVTIYKGKKMVGHEKEEFNKYIVCSSCEMLYTLENAVQFTLLREKISGVCTYVRYPNHPHKTRRKQCGSTLMKTIISMDGNKKLLQAKRTYCFQSVTQSLKRLISKDQFRKLLIERYNDNDNDILYDIWDGSIWKEFKDCNGDLFFCNRRNIGLMLNVDWFQPFKNSDHSEGAIYLSVLNLPLQERIKWENTILVGIIPGPKEPSLNMNTYLKPLVDELLLLWNNGILVNENGMHVIYNVALLCISSDIPATRKCGGFLNFNATKGCSKCHKEFIHGAFGTKPDYSGWDCKNWRLREGDEHKMQASEALRQPTKTGIKEMESLNGARYSELFRLPYYDPIRSHVIDPMHNLLLGVAKHTFITWIEIGVLTDEKLSKIDEKMSNLKIPTDMGRISKKISSCYKSLKAEEWKHWILNYSTYCLYSELEEAHFVMWKLFVCACSKILKRSISKQEVKESHTLLVMFCEKYTALIGSDYWTPNMHLQLHLKDCLLEYGPAYGWWCMSFERFNGVLGSYILNNKNISVQLMNRFVNNAKIQSKFLEIQKQCEFEIFTDNTRQSSDNYNDLYKLRHKERIQWADIESVSYATVVSKPKKIGLDAFVFTYVENILKALNVPNLERVSKFVQSYDRIKVGSEIVTTSKYRGGNSRSCNVLARYIGVDLDLIKKNVRPCKISKIFEITFTFIQDQKQVTKIMPFIEVEWYEQHAKEHFLGYSSPVKIYGYIENAYNTSNIIPLFLIEKRCAVVKEEIEMPRKEVANLVIPLIGPNSNF